MLAFIIVWLAMSGGFVINPTRLLDFCDGQTTEVRSMSDVLWLRVLDVLGVGFGVWLYLHVLIHPTNDR